MRVIFFDTLQMMEIATYKNLPSIPRQDEVYRGNDGIYYKITNVAWFDEDGKLTAVVYMEIK